VTRYAKALVAVLGAAATAAAGTLPPDTTAWKVITAVLAIATATGVWGVPNATLPKPLTGEHRRVERASALPPPRSEQPKDR